MTYHFYGQNGTLTAETGGGLKWRVEGTLTPDEMLEAHAAVMKRLATDPDRKSFDKPEIPVFREKNGGVVFERMLTTQSEKDSDG